MTNTTSSTGVQPRVSGFANTAPLLGQVLILVSVSLGLAAVGARAGRDLSPAASIVVTFAVIGMLIIQAVGGPKFRVGLFAVAWLGAIGLGLGLGIGPTIAFYSAADPSAIIQAAVTTTLVVASMGVGGLTLDKDLSAWLRPLTFVILGLFVLTLVLFLVGAGGSPLISLAIAGVSAVCILVDFNYLRQHGTEDDVVLLATGIFVSVVNIFLSLLNVFSSDSA
jgi:modulator of FtsH protease